MAERFLFFNSAPSDPRKYQAQDFAEYFGSVLSSGLLHTDNVPGMKAAVEAGTLNTIVSPGKAVLRGHLYENTTPLTLAHDLPETSLDRIDRIVLRLNLNNAVRDIKLHVLTGVPAGVPVAPSLTRTPFIYEISLAQVFVRKNTVQLLPTDLIDERLDEQLCGLVYSLISVPTDQFQTKLEQFQADWDVWFSNIQGVLPNEAELVSIKDTTNLFTSVDVEGALKEAITQANAAFTSASNGKTAVANAVTAKGVSASPSDTFPVLATKIGQISTGKKWASGIKTTNIVANVNTVFSNALPFTANTVVIASVGPQPVTITAYLINGSWVSMNSFQDTRGSILRPSLNSNAIIVRPSGDNGIIVEQQYNWWAFE